MTSRHRQLKEAQQHVNDAVARLAMRRSEINAMGIAADFTINCGEVLDVVRAYAAFDQLRRDLDGDAAHAQRDTSANAAIPFPRSGSMRRKIIHVVAAHVNSYHTGMTVAELTARFHSVHQTVSSAVNYLEGAGFLKNSGETRTTGSGSDAIVWEPTARAWDFIRQINCGVTT